MPWTPQIPRWGWTDFFPRAFGGFSALFGLAHAGLPGQANAVQAGVFGLYLGWLHQRNEYQIGEGVAIHFWWNFLLSLAALAEHEEGAQVVLYTYFARF